MALTDRVIQPIDVNASKAPMTFKARDDHDNKALQLRRYVFGKQALVAKLDGIGRACMPEKILNVVFVLQWRGKVFWAGG